MRDLSLGNGTGGSRKAIGSLGGLLVCALAVALGLFLASLASSPQTAEAGPNSHWRFGHITWVTAPPPAAANTANFTFTVGFRCSAFLTAAQCANPATVGTNVSPANFNFGDLTATISPTLTISSIDTAADWFLASGTFSHTYAGPGPFTADTNSCCRIGTATHVNNPNLNWRTEAIVDFNQTTGNPVSSLPPIIDCTKFTTCNFTIPVLDPDGQTTNCRMSTAAEMGQASITQPGPPDSTFAASVGGATCKYQWDSTGATILGGDTLYSTQVTIEELDALNVVVGKSSIDFFIRLVQTVNNPPKFVQPPTPCGQNLKVSEGQKLQFNVQAADSNDLPAAKTLVSLGVLNLPAGATFPIPPAANPVTGTFNWTPGLGQAGAYAFTFTATDGSGGSAPPCGVTIQVNPAPPPDEQININVVDKLSGAKLEGTCWRISYGPAKIQHDVVGDDSGGVKPDCGEPSNVKLFDKDPSAGNLRITITSAQRVQFGDIWHAQMSFEPKGRLDTFNYVCDLSLAKCEIGPVAVGGLAVDLDADGTPLDTAQSSGSNAALLAAIAGIAALAVTLSGAAWYARRRWVN